MGAYYHIEGNYYLIPDEISWNIGKQIRISKSTGKPEFSFISYHSTPEDALRYYLKIKQRSSAIEGGYGTITDLVDKLTAETKSFTETLKKLVSMYDPDIDP